MSHPPVEAFFFKILIVGDSSTGTADLFNHLTRSRPCFRCPTTGVRGISLTFVWGRALLTVHLWDIGGHERRSVLRSSLFSDAHAAFLHYDLCDQSSFHHLKDWILDLRTYAGEGIVMGLIGTKSNGRLPRVVAWPEEPVELAITEGLVFAGDIPLLNPQSSAILGFSILIWRLLHDIIRRREGEGDHSRGNH